VICPYGSSDFLFMFCFLVISSVVFFVTEFDTCTHYLVLLIPFSSSPCDFVASPTRREFVFLFVFFLSFSYLLDNTAYEQSHRGLQQRLLA